MTQARRCTEKGLRGRTLANDFGTCPIARTVSRRYTCQFDWAPAGARTMSSNSSTRIASHSTEKIVLEARRKLREDKRGGMLPKEDAPAGLPVSEIIRHCNLAVPPSTDNVSFMERYFCWLALWAYNVLPVGVREKRFSTSP